MHLRGQPAVTAHYQQNHLNNYQQQQSETNAGRSCPQLALILITLFLLLTAVILAVIALLNPSWQVVDIREFQAEHHHGLYTDCTRAERNPSPSRRLESFVEKSPLHCTYKFDQHALDNVEAQIHDIDSNAAAAEAEHHQFYGLELFNCYKKFKNGFIFVI
uniref:Uncharacterized protein n=1 Tax=Meloidogyne incognita TaxID=6306 RepID=A0A914KRE9_MELIC